MLPGVTVVPTGGHSAGHQAIVVPGAAARRPLAFFGDLCMRPWRANPRWVTAFDDFPLDSVVVKASLFAQAADEDWTSCCRTNATIRSGASSATGTASATRRTRGTCGRVRQDRLDPLGCALDVSGPWATKRIAPSGSMKNWVGSA